MTFRYRLGKREARHDMRIPRMSKHAPGLPPPPPSVNWFSDIGDWFLLGNDTVGDCVEAAVMHTILQQTSYAMAPVPPPQPTDAEAISFYSGATGYVPGDASTDQGSFVLGPGGVMEYWLKTGVVCGGVLNRPTGFLQITQPSPHEWRQALSSFGNLLVGLQLPEAIVSSDVTPEVWSHHTGPVAGGHEVLLVGYQTTSHGTLYDLVSWGQLFKATEAFLLAVADEVVTVVDTAFMNLKGVDAAGIDLAALEADMATLRDEA